MEKNIYVGTAKDVLGIAKRTGKHWLSERTWKKVGERRQLKLQLESTRSERIKQKMRKQYKEKDQEVNERTERLKIWKEHFNTVLKREPPVIPIQPHDIETMQNDRKFDIGLNKQK